MPNLLLLNFVSTLKHESLLEVRPYAHTHLHISLYTMLTQQQASANIESQRLHMNLPFPDINKSIFHYHHLIADNNHIKKGISPGDAINLVGQAECTWLLNKIITFTVDHTSAHIVYIDTNINQSSFTAKDHPQVHYFKNQNIIHCLDTFLSLHSDWHVLYVMWDGADDRDSKCLDILRQLQKKWSFILWTTTTKTDQDSFHFVDYKFQLTRGESLKMQLIWPMHMDVFNI